jgi:tRNA (guanine-N7-)-methyltransferase
MDQGGLNEVTMEAGRAVVSDEDFSLRIPLLAQPRPYRISSDFRPGRGLRSALPADFRGPIHVEIGAGGGDFCIEYAKGNPNDGVIAIERKLNYLLRAVRKVRGQDLPNLVLVNGDALYLFQEYLEPESVDAVHIYFPDPWPKKRHAKRRIFRAETLTTILARIRMGGSLHIRTDVEGYFLQATAILDHCPALRRYETPESIRCHRTNFEKKFVAQGLPIYWTSYETLGPVTLREPTAGPVCSP